MELVELNPADNFELWQAAKLEELKAKKFDGTQGLKLLFENDALCLWGVMLKPNHRIPFRSWGHKASWTCPQGGLVLTRNANGKIELIRLKEWDSAIFHFDQDGNIFDLENIGEEALQINIMEYKSIAIAKLSDLGQMQGLR